MNWIEDHDHYAGPTERRKKRLEDAEDEIGQQRDDAVEEHVVEAAARCAGLGHWGGWRRGDIVVRTQGLWGVATENSGERW